MIPSLPHDAVEFSHSKFLYFLVFKLFTFAGVVLTARYITAITAFYYRLKAAFSQNRGK